MLQRPHHNSKKSLSNCFLPDYIAQSVEDIDFKYLAEHGIKAALIDLDGTVVVRDTFTVSSELCDLLASQPLKIYIATNRPKSRSLKNLKELLHAQGVIHPIGMSPKPLPAYYAQAMKDHGLVPSETVMIGDRYLQDVCGANLAGLHTIVVRKLGTARSYMDKLISGIERRRTDALVRSYTEIKR